LLTIQLKDLLFRSFHGVYQEETVLGGDFLVNLTVDFIPPLNIIRQLDETLNYETLFERVKQKMDKPTPLLETIAMELADEILRNYHGVNKVWVAIEKRNPPIPGLTGSVQVSYTAIAG
jgi:7,8-dihydroneopterin aldolase/epimerase/oxygenase